MAAQIVPLQQHISAQRRTALINRYAALNRELGKLKTELELCKAEAIDALGEGEHTTTTAKVTIHWTERPILDQAKAKSFLTASQLAQATKQSTFYDVRVKLL